MNRPARILLLVAALMLSACSRTQSALAPSGPHAGAVETLGWIMFIGGSLIFLLVMVLTAITIVVPQDRRRWLAHRNTVIAGGIAFPLVVLTALLVYGLFVGRALTVDADNPALRIEVVGSSGGGGSDIWTQPERYASSRRMKSAYRSGNP